MKIEKMWLPVGQVTTDACNQWGLWAGSAVVLLLYCNAIDILNGFSNTLNDL